MAHHLLSANALHVYSEDNKQRETCHFDFSLMKCSSLLMDEFHQRQVMTASHRSLAQGGNPPARSNVHLLGRIESTV